MHHLKCPHSAHKDCIIISNIGAFVRCDEGLPEDGASIQTSEGKIIESIDRSQNHLW